MLLLLLAQGGSNVLHYACSHGHIGLTSLLLSHGADPNCRNANGATPVRSGTIPGGARARVRARAVTRAGACACTTELPLVARPNRYGCRRPQLHFAVWKGHKEIAEMLLRQGGAASVGVAAGSSLWFGKQTPLQFAHATADKANALLASLREHASTPPIE